MNRLPWRALWFEGRFEPTGTRNAVNSFTLHHFAMIHVVHLLHELMPSGAETMLAVAGPHWAQHGVRCTVLATAPRLGPFATALAAAGYGVAHVPMDRNLSSWLALRRWLREQQVHCLHIHKETDSFRYVLAGLGVVRHSVSTHHNNFRFSGRVRLRRGIERGLARLLGVQHIAIGQSVSDNEWQHFRNRTVTIHNWFDPKRFYPATCAMRQAARKDLGLADGQKAILSVGNCNAVKNHGTLIRALTRPALAQLVYLHAGTEDSLQTERALARALGVDDRVRFLGSRTDVDQLLAACDGFVMPSLYEGLPISALEALVSGVPCLLAGTAGLRDFRADAPQVQWCDTDDIGVASALEEWLPQLTAEGRLRCIQQATLVADAYSVSRGISAYVAAYQGVHLADGGSDG